MYKNIMVPVALDGESNVAASISVAKTLQGEGGSITLLHVVEEVPGFVASQLPDGIAAKHRASSEAALGEIAKNAGAEFKTKVVRGHANRTIVDEADAMNVDCIVMASHRPGLEDYLIGSTAARVMRHASCSVHVIR